MRIHFYWQHQIYNSPYEVVANIQCTYSAYHIPSTYWLSCNTLPSYIYWTINSINKLRIFPLLKNYTPIYINVSDCCWAIAVVVAIVIVRNCAATIEMLQFVWRSNEERALTLFRIFHHHICHFDFLLVRYSTHTARTAKKKSLWWWPRRQRPALPRDVQRNEGREKKKQLPLIFHNLVQSPRTGLCVWLKKLLPKYQSKRGESSPAQS